MAGHNATLEPEVERAPSPAPPLAEGQAGATTTEPPRVGEVISNSRSHWCSVCKQPVRGRRPLTMTPGPRTVTCRKCKTLLRTNFTFRVNWMLWSLMKICPLFCAGGLLAIGVWKGLQDGDTTGLAIGKGVAGGAFGLLAGLIPAAVLYLPAQVAVDAFRGVFGRKPAVAVSNRDS